MRECLLADVFITGANALSQMGEMVNIDYAGQPIIISEFGGIAFADNGSGWGYGDKVAGKDAFIKRFDEITTVVKQIPYVCGYCYTQITDVQQEINGLLDIDRNYKIDPDIIKAINEK